MCCLQTHAELYAFDGIDTEHGGSEGDIKLVEYRLSQSGRCAGDDTCHHASDGVAAFSYFHDELFHPCCHLRVGAADGIAFDDRHVEMVVGPIDMQGTYCTGICRHVDSGLRKGLHGERSGYDPCDGLACTATASSTVVAYAVFGLIGVIGMARTEYMPHVVIVVAVLVGVAYYETYGSACGDAVHELTALLRVFLVAGSDDT